MGVLIPLALLVVLLIFVAKATRRGPPLPPGPPADPLIGHLRIIPPGRQEDAFCKWAKIYGAVFHVHIPGRSIVVLNTVQAAVDLLEKRSANYSDRPRFILFEIMGFVASLPFLPYGKQFHNHRRMYHSHLNRKRCESYREHQTQEMHRLLEAIKTSPHDHREHLRRFSAAIIMQITYQYQIISHDDKYLKLAKEVGHRVSLCGQPGGTPVDFLTFLRYLPSWFPGTHYVHKAKEVNHSRQLLYDSPFDAVKKQMESGQAQSSFVADSIEELEAKGGYTDEEIIDIKGAAATMNAAGADTTWTTLTIFLIAMVLYPECQVKAHQEIDSVLGQGRLPDFNDRDSLRYVECIVQETYRWYSVFPLGVPHRSLEDDIYNGMFIPKGSIVIANARAMSLDETVYSNPHIFKPERFLPKPLGNGEPYSVAHFGFGRRICSGQYLADSSAWIAIASILSTFTISKSIGEDGLEITPEVEFVYGLTSHLKPYQCDIKLRDNVPIHT